MESLHPPWTRPTPDTPAHRWRLYVFLACLPATFWWSFSAPWPSSVRGPLSLLLIVAMATLWRLFPKGQQLDHLIAIPIAFGLCSPITGTLVLLSQNVRKRGYVVVAIEGISWLILLGLFVHQGQFAQLPLSLDLAQATILCGLFWSSPLTTASDTAPHPVKHSTTPEFSGLVSRIRETGHRLFEDTQDPLLRNRAHSVIALSSLVIDLIEDTSNIARPSGLQRRDGANVDTDVRLLLDRQLGPLNRSLQRSNTAVRLIVPPLTNTQGAIDGRALVRFFDRAIRAMMRQTNASNLTVTLEEEHQTERTLRVCIEGECPNTPHFLESPSERFELLTQRSLQTLVKAFGGELHRVRLREHQPEIRFSLPFPSCAYTKSHKALEGLKVVLVAEPLHLSRGTYADLSRLGASVELVPRSRLLQTNWPLPHVVIVDIPSLGHPLSARDLCTIWPDHVPVIHLVTGHMNAEDAREPACTLLTHPVPLARWAQLAVHLPKGTPGDNRPRNPEASRR